jgi:hypothetical protein
MKEISILYICRNAEIVDTMVRVINKTENWKGVGVQTDDQAMEIFSENNFDIILLGSGIEEASEKRLRSYFTSRCEDVIVIQHYGGGSGLLQTEILQALGQKD